MIFDSYENIIIEAELDVKISVLPYKGCYIDRIRSFDDRCEFINVYNLNKLNLQDRRLIKVHMSSSTCEDLGEQGVRVNITDGSVRLVIGERCKYIPYQLIKDCKDGDTFDYIIILPFNKFIKLHVTCEQDSYQYYNFNDNYIGDNFKTFNNATSHCVSSRLSL